MEAKYRLKDGVYFTRGASRGAILDTNTSYVYSINEEACKVCTNQVEDESFWHTLVSMGIAGRADLSLQPELPRLMIDNQLKFIWFEIVTNDCNQRCIHCYANSMPKIFREAERNGEVHPGVARTKKRMSYMDWLKVIKEAKELGCNACQFIGGEPLLYIGECGETVFDLLKFAKQAGYTSVEIFTNATMLSREHILWLKELEIKVAVSLYSDNPLIHDRITQVPGSHKRTLDSLELLRKYGVETRVEMVVMKANQDTVEATLVLRKAMGYKGRNPDPLRPSGRGDSSVNQPDDIHLVQYGFTLRPNFKASKEKIAHFRSGNPCLLGKLAITEFGDILPCIFAREHRIGNYAGLDSLCEVINSPRLQKIWHMTKDDVYVCRDCEYRYVCFDCRPLAEKVANGRSDFQSAPYPRCTYNPYTGQWGTGVWMLDRQGEPYYDQSLSAEIIHVRQSMERS